MILVLAEQKRPISMTTKHNQKEGLPHTACEIAETVCNTGAF